MVNVDELLHHRVLTPQVEEIRSPGTFLEDLLYTNRQPVPDETIEISVIMGEREVAPFVEVNGEAINVDGYDEDFQTVTAPNIRMKRPMKATEVLGKRMGGTRLYASSEDKTAAFQRAIALDNQRLADLRTNAKEYLAAMSLTGVIAYKVARQANFRIDFQRKASHNISVGTAWTDLANSQPQDDLLGGAQVINDDSDLNPTHALFSKEAARNMFKNENVKGFLDNRRIELGGLRAELFRRSGARFLGFINEIECWEYGRSVMVNGVSTPLIREGYVELVHAGPDADFVEYFGAIPDMAALEDGLWEGEVFAKSFMTDDPSVRWALQHSRPLPVPRRINSTASIDTSP